MKKINLWVVLLLNIVTLGIYSLFWTINRRSEMVTRYKRTIPHWWWLLLPALVMLAMGLTLLLLFALTGDNDGLGMAFTIFLTLAILAMIVNLVIIIWWSWKFFKAAEYVANGRAPAGWIMAIAIFASPLQSLFLQYYFNKAEAPAKLATMPKTAPSRNFILLAILAIILGITFNSKNEDRWRWGYTYENGEWHKNATQQMDDGFYDRYY